MTQNNDPTVSLTKSPTKSKTLNKYLVVSSTKMPTKTQNNDSSESYKHANKDFLQRFYNEPDKCFNQNTEQ